jgi:hypothetical protein
MSTTKAIREACERLDVEVRSYSGRGMYGKECIGFVVPQRMSAAQFAFNFAVELSADDEDGPEAIEEFHGRTWCQDSLGLDTIVYVPGVAPLAEEDEEEDEEEEEDSEERRRIDANTAEHLERLADHYE